MGTASSIPYDKRSDDIVSPSHITPEMHSTIPSTEAYIPPSSIPTKDTLSVLSHIEEDPIIVNKMNEESILNEPLRTRQTGNIVQTKRKEPKVTFVTNSHDDGYKWRKYGNKKAKNIQRSYFKCRHEGCPVKKIAEKIIGDDNAEEKISYKGEHNHSAPIFSHISANSYDDFKCAISHFSEKAKESLNETTGTLSGKEDILEPKLVISLPLDLNPQELNDGYHWRKYGQKSVKGSPFPRSYFKCTQEPCNVKKQVERDSQKYICTYEGIHYHEIPPKENESFQLPCIGIKRPIPQDVETQKNPSPPHPEYI